MAINRKAMAALITATLAVGFTANTSVSKVYDIVKVVDGDTIELKLYKIPENLQKVSIRVYGVDTPEKGWRAECPEEKALAEKASAFTTKKVAEAKDIQISFIQWDKFGGRIDGDLLLDGESLSKMLINNGYARPYFGEKKTSWCGK